MSINDIIDRLSVAEASEILCRLQDAEIEVSVPECNKDVAEEIWKRCVTSIYLSRIIMVAGNLWWMPSYSPTRN